VSEIYAIKEVVKDARLQHWVAEEMGCTIAWPFVLKTDSKQAVSFADETCARSTVRGSFDWRVDWVNEIRDKKQVALQHVYGNVNHADITTIKVYEGPGIPRKTECCRELWQTAQVMDG